MSKFEIKPKWFYTLEERYPVVAYTYDYSRFWWSYVVFPSERAR